MRPCRPARDASPMCFATSYGTVDRELPALIARERPARLVMFGLAQRTRHVRIEILARNTLSRTHADVAGILPTDNAIVADAPAALALPAPALRLLAAARTAGTGRTLAQCRQLSLQLSVLACERKRHKHRRAAGRDLRACAAGASADDNNSWSDAAHAWRFGQGRRGHCRGRDHGGAHTALSAATCRRAIAPTLIGARLVGTRLIETRLRSAAARRS